MRTKRRLSRFYFGVGVLLAFAGVNFGLDAATGSGKQTAVASAPAPGPAEVSRTPALLPIQVDGQLLEPAWSKAEKQTGFVYPWSKRTPPATQFRALVDSERLWFEFEVEDADIVLAKEFSGESSVDQEDRVDQVVRGLESAPFRRVGEDLPLVLPALDLLPFADLDAKKDSMRAT